MSRQEMAKEACTPAYAVSSPEPDGVQYLWKASRSCQWVHVSFFACRVFSAVAVLVSGWSQKEEHLVPLTCSLSWLKSGICICDVWSSLNSPNTH